jgi:hypothetical protein
MHQRRRLVAFLAAVPLLLLAGCTGGFDPPEPAAAGTSSSASSSSSTPPSSPTTPKGPGTSGPAAPTDEDLPGDASFPADTSADGGPAQAGSAGDPAGHAGGVGLRLSTHDGFTRLVIDLHSNGVPEWNVGYSEASGPGGGPVVIDGDAFLRVSLKTGIEPSGQGEQRVRTDPGAIAEVLTTGYFEGSEEVLIGVRGGELPFRAFALTDPGRIVIDVRSAG